MSQKLLQTITALYRENNYTGHERHSAIRSLYHSLIRDKELAKQFLDKYQFQIFDPGYSNEYSKLNYIDIDWGKQQYQKTFAELEPKERFLIVSKIFDEFSKKLQTELDNSLKATEKTYSKKQVEAANKHQSSIRKRLRALSPEVDEYMNSLYLDISKKDKEKKLRTFKSETDLTYPDQKDFFDRERPFTEEEEKDFREKVLKHSGKKGNDFEEQLVNDLLDRYLKNRTVLTNNKPQQNKIAAAKLAVFSKTMMKEAIFTIPKTQAVFYDPQTLIDIGKEFTKKYFPDYDCSFVIHKDELRQKELDDLKNKDLLKSQDIIDKLSMEGREKYNFSGDHLHIFISGWDKKGNHNLLEYEQKIIAQYVKDNNIELINAQGEPVDFTKKGMTHSEQILFGSVKQTMFREFFNEFLNKQGLNIEKLDSNERDPKFDLEQKARGIAPTKQQRNEEFNIESFIRTIQLKEEAEQAKQEKKEAEIKKSEIISNINTAVVESMKAVPEAVKVIIKKDETFKEYLKKDNLELDEEGKEVLTKLKEQSRMLARGHKFTKFSDEEVDKIVEESEATKKFMMYIARVKRSELKINHLGSKLDNRITLKATNDNIEKSLDTSLKIRKLASERKKKIEQLEKQLNEVPNKIKQEKEKAENEATKLANEAKDKHYKKIIEDMEKTHKQDLKEAQELAQNTNYKILWQEEKGTSERLFQQIEDLKEEIKTIKEVAKGFCKTLFNYASGALRQMIWNDREKEEIAEKIIQEAKDDIKNGR